MGHLHNVSCYPQFFVTEAWLFKSENVGLEWFGQADWTIEEMRDNTGGGG